MILLIFRLTRERGNASCLNHGIKWGRMTGRMALSNEHFQSLIHVDESASELCFALLCGPRSELRQGSRFASEYNLTSTKRFKYLRHIGDVNRFLQTSNRSRKRSEVLCPPGTPTRSGSSFFALTETRSDLV